MADYRIQLKDKEGNRQFPVTTIQSIVDNEGRSLEEILANLGDGGGSGGGSAPASSGPLRVWLYQNDMSELTQQQVDDNIATYNAIASGDITSVLVCVKFEDDSLLSVSTYHATSDYVAYSNGQKFVTVTIYGVDADLLVTAVAIVLNADGTITME